MAILDSILSAVSGKTDSAGGATALIGALSGLLEQNGGLQGLANKFSHSGAANIFASWVGTGENESISSAQIQPRISLVRVRSVH